MFLDPVIWDLIYTYVMVAWLQNTIKLFFHLFQKPRKIAAHLHE